MQYVVAHRNMRKNKPMDPIAVSDRLVRRLRPLKFQAPITHVYNPLDYAAAPHRRYLERYGQGQRDVLLLGMNPGPWGMAQTGVPFGEISLVRDWLGIDAPVKKPRREHPKRPIEGFACRRSEVSGARLWGWAKERFDSADAFFKTFFVANYCPLVFMEESGKNRTPDKLPAAERTAVEQICDQALRDLVSYFSPRWVIGIGAFARKSAERALDGIAVNIGAILHPSPASPAANRGWAPQAEKQLRDLGIEGV